MNRICFLILLVFASVSKAQDKPLTVKSSSATTVRDSLIKNYWSKEDYITYLFPGAPEITTRPVFDAPVYSSVKSGVYKRPDLNTIRKDLGKISKTHPRLFLNTSRVEELKELVQEDEFAKKCYKNVMDIANRVLLEPVIPFQISGRKVILQSHLTNDYQIPDRITALGLAYFISNDRKYAERAIQEMKSVAKWPDWGNNYGGQFLATGQVCMGMAIGYDWFFNLMSKDQQNEIFQAILLKGIRPGLFYHAIRENRWTTRPHNWNSVCNGGLSLLALSIAEEDPEVASLMLYKSLAGLEWVLNIYAPLGDYEEGPRYWAYGTGFLVSALSGMESVLGTSYGLADAPGFDKTPYFVALNIGPAGLFNFHDTPESSKNYVTNAEFFWFSDRYKNSDFYSIRLSQPQQYKEGSSRDLLWYKGKQSGSAKLKLNYVSTANNNQLGTGTFRSSWEDKDAAFLGFDAGYQLAVHGQLDVGSFIFDVMGERWVMDVGDGRGDTSIQLYWDSAKDGQRYNNYRVRAEGNNTLVINPDSRPGQDYTSANRPVYKKVSTGSKNPFAIVDITCAYPEAMKGGQRGFMLDKKNKIAIIQDECILLKPSEVYSFLHTRAKIEILEGEPAAILTLGGKRLYVHLAGDTKGMVLKAMPAKGLTSNVFNMKGMDDVQKLAILFKDTRVIDYAIMLIPLKDNQTKPTFIPEFRSLKDWN